jgi:hypothetical protein
VRDLAWACFSPPLLQISQLAEKEVYACTPRLSAARAEWLAQLDRDPAALLEHLSENPTHRLGIYFEQLWHFFLQQDPETDLIAHNIAVHEAGKTLGEFDCIYYDRPLGCHVHLELAVKYFLGLPRNRDTSNATNRHEWLGPDRHDSLEAKLDQLLQRQIRLGDTAAGRRKLAALNIRTTRREIALKGYLFQPLSTPPPPPPGYNPACAMNVWLTYEELDGYCAALDSSAFFILPKMAWLSASQHPALNENLDRHELKAHVLARFANDPHPLLIAALDRNGLEASRFFVTPQGWPSNRNQEDIAQIARL